MGIRPAEFWKLTYAEFIEIYRGHVSAHRQRINEMLSGAWHVAALSRQPKLPDLQSILLSDEPDKEQEKPQPKQTSEQMFAMLRALNAAMGGAEEEM